MKKNLQKNQNNIQKTIWHHKKDFAEINKQNFHLVLSEYFALNTKKVVMMALLLALNIILTVISRYILGAFAIGGFFVIEISFCSVLMFYYIYNLFYGIIFLELTVWFRMILGSEPIGLLMMNLVDGFYLLVFALAVFCFKIWWIHHGKKPFFKNLFIYEIVITIFIILLTSGVAVFFNAVFALRWWGMDESQIKGLLPLLFGLNICKYVINAMFYFMGFSVLTTLIKHYKL